MNSKVWFITGASRGFGRVWAEAALKRGDKVAATARTLANVADLKEKFDDAVLPLALDVTNADQVQQAVHQAHTHFGRLDVVLNNAGYALVGTTEEASEADVRAVFDANYFGTLRVIQAALPLLRQQGSGHILGVSSTLGIIAMPLIGFYSATKWAVEALHESLAQEVKPFGIKVTLIEPGAYATEFGSPASLKQSQADALLTVVDAEEPPLRMMLGSHNLPAARAAYADRLATWEAWETVSNTAQGGPK
jgi:NAD(P)-dependent dehydrogenase (short-subunit alcohol dehydrogenase family)